MNVMNKEISLGTQGLSVNRVGLGCMGMSEFYGASDKAENLRVLDHALEIGCHFWDTADMYGPFTNEELLSEALSNKRDKVTLATKFGISRNEAGDWLGVRGDAKYVRESCEASLKRLKVDHIDLYYQHRVDPETPIEETVGAMADLVKEGKIKYIGLSEADPETIKRAHAVHPISALQTEYSLWTRDVEAQILPLTQQLGIGFVAYSPLGRGFLSGTVRSRKDLQPGDWRLDNPRFTDEALAKNADIADQVAKIASVRGVSAAQIALAWVMSHGEHIAIIPGTRKIERLEENVTSAQIDLTETELEALNALPYEAVIGERY